MNYWGQDCSPKSVSPVSPGSLTSGTMSRERRPVAWLCWRLWLYILVGTSLWIRGMLRIMFFQGKALLVTPPTRVPKQTQRIQQTTLKTSNTTAKKKLQIKFWWRCSVWGLGYCGGRREKEKERWQSDAENINVWNGHYYFIQMPFLCLKNLSCNGSTNAAHVKRKPRDHRWFKWERRAYAKTTCVTAISKQWICGKLGRTLTFFRAQAAC